ncbi:MAG: hypothetical protein LJE89_09575 [Deltaproteobacteria bacterium]|nr:hypothetical protein [Deltaproteobacteria bacterium]
MNHKVPSIVDTLLANGGENISRYFMAPEDGKGDKRIWDRVSKGDQLTASKWIDKFTKRANQKILDHDEPWLTLVSMYGLCGDQADKNNPRVLAAINEMFLSVFGYGPNQAHPPRFDELIGVHLELKVPEILKYRRFLKEEVFKEGPFHLYPDRRRLLEEKLSGEEARLEGNTNFDILISGRSDGRKIHVFIEAKFLSDISKDITYVPARNQIARNIDCAIDLMTAGGNDLKGLEDFWFVLLTPGIFRTERYGGPVLSPIAHFLPQRSRLFCYKMEDYLHPDFLRRDLPHWKDKLDDQHWTFISKRIGWLTYEDIADIVVKKGTLAGDTLEDFQEFFRDRCLSP